jgi:hypothetical protein
MRQAAVYDILDTNAGCATSASGGKEVAAPGGVHAGSGGQQPVAQEAKRVSHRSVRGVGGNGQDRAGGRGGRAVPQGRGAPGEVRHSGGLGDRASVRR